MRKYFNDVARCYFLNSTYWKPFPRKLWWENWSTAVPTISTTNYYHLIRLEGLPVAILLLPSWSLLMVPLMLMLMFSAAATLSLELLNNFLNTAFIIIKTLFHFDFLFFLWTVSGIISFNFNQLPQLSYRLSASQFNWVSLRHRPNISLLIASCCVPQTRF